MENNRTACIILRKYKPVLHLIEVNARDYPIEKTFCGKTVKRNKYYYVYEETSTKPTCKRCIQKQRRDQKPTKSLI